MAKIINNTPRGSWQQDCPHCLRLIEFSPKDIVSGRDPDDWSSYRYVTCPACKCSIDKPERSDYEDDTY